MLNKTGIPMRNHALHKRPTLPNIGQIALQESLLGTHLLADLRTLSCKGHLHRIQVSRSLAAQDHHRGSLTEPLELDPSQSFTESAPDDGAFGHDKA
jgi:hypothetical protein